MTGLLAIVLGTALVSGFLAYRRSVHGRPGEAAQGGLYSVVADEGKYGIAKVLRVEPGAVHVRLYQGRFKERPTSVNPASLQIGRFDEPDPGMGHLPLAPHVFTSWQPRLLALTVVTEDELDGYNEWKRAGAGVWGR